MDKKKPPIKTSQGPLDREDEFAWQQAKDLYDQGSSMPEVAKFLGIGTSTLHRQFKLFNWPVRSFSDARRKCQKKIEQTMLTTYGVVNPTQSEVIRAKSSVTNLERYGAENPLQAPGLQDKIRGTLMSKYGAEHISNSEYFKEKFKEVVNEKYGVDHPSQLQAVKDKKALTTQKNYGVDNPFQSPEIMDRIGDQYEGKHGSGVRHPSQVPGFGAEHQKTMLRKHGVDHQMQIPEVKEKVRLTCQDRYGVDNPMQSDEIRERLEATMMSTYGVKNILAWVQLKRSELNAPILVQKLKDRGYLFLDTYQGIHTQKLLGSYTGYHRYKIKHVDCGCEFYDDVGVLPRCPVCFPLQGSRRSQLEDFYSKYVSSLGVKVLNNSRELVISKSGHWYEIDIAVPEKKVLFEVNGLYWHAVTDRENASAKDSGYHQRKTDAALKAGFRLYHIWEHDNPEIVKSKIKIVLGLSARKVHARSTTFKQISAAEAEMFLTQYHMQGFARGFLHCALVLDDDILSVMSFRDNGEDIEIARMATAQDMVVVGGFQKLLKHMIVLAKGLRFKATKLVTYADRDWSPDSTQTVYHKTGFQLIGDSGPSMYYTDFRQVYYRQVFQKHKLAQLFPSTFDANLTEIQNLSLQGIYPIYTAGNWKYFMSL